MAPRRPGAGELLAGAGGLLLLLVMFLPWFGLDGRARVPGINRVITVDGGNLNAWQAFDSIDVVLALVAAMGIAVLVVGLVAKPPPALTVAAAGAAALAALLIVYRLIDVPDIPIAVVGDTTYETGRRLGAFFGLLCTAGIAVGANLAAGEEAAAEPEPEPEPAAAPEPEPAAPAPPAPAAPPRSATPAPAPPAPAPAPAARAPERLAPAAPEPAAPAPAAPPRPATPAPAPPAPAPAPAARAPERPTPAPPAPAPPAPATSGPLGGWSRPAIEAECQTAWRRYDRGLGARYAGYFEEHLDLMGEQRTSARDLAAALPPGWDALAGAIPADAWQRAHLSAKSSQTLGVGLLGVAAGRDPSLAWLWRALAPLPPASGEPRVEFQHVVEPDLLGERPRQTGIDVLIDDSSVLIGIAVKWREHGIGPCGCRGEGVGPEAGARCSRRVEQRDAYWDAAATVLGLGDRDPDEPCSISPVYEAVRHAAALRALAGSDRPAVLALLYDDANPYFAAEGDWPGWPALLSEAVDAKADPERFRFVAVSWQELVPDLPLDEQTRDWASDKHGLSQ
ncbi:MAG: hypothetical protein QOI45_2421 [Thermoleophilaceae bacterium]|nr:hypothetical protein [Thermoleophilaceae bacterium]